MSHKWQAGTVYSQKCKQGAGGVELREGRVSGGFLSLAFKTGWGWGAENTQRGTCEAEE